MQGGWSTMRTIGLRASARDALLDVDPDILIEMTRAEDKARSERDHPFRRSENVRYEFVYWKPQSLAALTPSRLISHAGATKPWASSPALVNMSMPRSIRSRACA